MITAGQAQQPDRRGGRRRALRGELERNRRPAALDHEAAAEERAGRKGGVVGAAEHADAQALTPLLALGRQRARHDLLAERRRGGRDGAVGLGVDADARRIEADVGGHRGDVLADRIEGRGDVRHRARGGGAGAEPERGGCGARVDESVAAVDRDHLRLLAGGLRRVEQGQGGRWRPPRPGSDR